MFGDLLARKSSSVLSELTPLTEEDKARLARLPFSVPADYLEFLSTIGWGSVRDCLQLYGGLSDPDEIYGERPDLPQGLMMFGDDYCGYCVGFYSGRPEVFEVEPGSMIIDRIADSFDSFIRQKIIELDD